jgi:hypothetical protein
MRVALARSSSRLTRSCQRDLRRAQSEWDFDFGCHAPRGLLYLACVADCYMYLCRRDHQANPLHQNLLLASVRHPTRSSYTRCCSEGSIGVYGEHHDESRSTAQQQSFLVILALFLSCHPRIVVSIRS